MNALAALPNALGQFGQYRNRLAVLLVLIVAVYFSVAFGEQAWRAKQLQAEVDDQQTALTRLNREHAQLQEQVNAYSTDAYFTYAAQRARRDLNLAYPGETLLLVRWQPGDQPATSSAPAATSAASEHKPNWRKWLDLFAP